MYAIVETGGKQYRVQEGSTVVVERLPSAEGEKITLNQVLAVSKDGSLTVGEPFVDGATVEATVLENGKSEKVIVFKYKRKKDYRRKQGHRQPFTKLKIESIQA